MLPEVITKGFGRLTNISVYSYIEYTDEYNSLGNFQLKTILNEDGRKLIQEGYYLLIDEYTCGVIQALNPEVDEETQETTLIVEGYLANQLLTRRCIPKSVSLSGTRSSIVKQLVTENCASPSNTNRQLPITVENYDPGDTEEIELQLTGGDIEEQIASVLDAGEMGHETTPVLTSTAMTGLNFRTLLGADRTIGNTAGNSPVVFSTDLKNILSGSYSYNTKSYKNTAIVAGEGEGTARNIRTVNDENTGVDRWELYVDARDLQSTDEEGNTLTTDQYNQVLDTRGSEKLEECTIAETYEATISVDDDRYVYRRDYYKGDKVTIKDDTIGIQIDARITAVKISISPEETHYDLTFGYPHMRIEKKLKRKGVI